MLNKDRIILETYEKKNELESMIYKWKENLANSHKEYTKADTIPEILTLLDQNSEWLENEGLHSTRGAYS